MKNRKCCKAIFCIFSIVFLMMLVTGCTTFDNFKHTFINKKTKSDKEVIYIGVYEPQSGAFEEQGKNEIKGIELAHSLYGSVKGMDIELITVDNQSDTESAKSAIKNLIEMKPSAIIGSVGEANSLIAGSYIEKAKIPAIAPSARNPLITENRNFYFRACITDPQIGEGLAEYAYSKLGAKSMGIIRMENDNSAMAVYDGLEQKLKSADQENIIVMDETLNLHDSNMARVIKRLKKEKPETVFMPVGIEKADRIFNRIEKNGLTNITFLGTREWNSKNFVRMMRKHPDIKVVFPAAITTGKKMTTTSVVTAEAQKFFIEYTRKYGENDIPTENTILGYDAYLILVNALSRADNMKDGEAVKEALADIENLHCATGNVTFDKNGNPMRPVNLSTLKKGEVVSVYTTNENAQASELKKIK